MTDNAEHEMREWLLARVSIHTPDGRMASAILARLDRPTLPRPEDVPDEALNAMLGEWFYSSDQDGNDGGMRAAYRALYDHYAQPPAPKPLGWAVLGAFDYGGPVLFHDKQNAIVFSNKYGGRVVKLVEDRSE